MEGDAGQRSQKGSVIGYCSCGVAYPPRVKRGGDRNARRMKQRANWGRSRDNRTISCALARALNPLQGGSAPRNTETSSKLQILQHFSVTGSGDGQQIRPSKGHAVYVGISTPTSRSAKMDENSGEKTEEKENKKGSTTVIGTASQNKFPRSVDDGLLLVVTARINGHSVRAMIDSGATRCFITPACVTAVGLKGKPQDTFLELGNGQKYLSRGFVPDVPVVTASLTVRMGLTVTALLHNVDIVLGMNWLQLVSPLIDWTNGKVYLPNSVSTALLHGDWVEGHVKAGTVTVLAGQDQLTAMQDNKVQQQISVLKSPKFWKIKTTNDDNSISWTKFFKGRVQWGYLYNKDCEFCKTKTACKEGCKHRSKCKLYSFVNEEGDEIVKVQRVNVNAKLPVRGTEGQQGMIWLQLMLQ